ncbi:hypothetical protein DERP_014417, partial [Dermatophagoides pteronyssinus]
IRLSLTKPKSNVLLSLIVQLYPNCIFTVIDFVIVDYNSKILKFTIQISRFLIYILSTFDVSLVDIGDIDKYECSSSIDGSSVVVVVVVVIESFDLDVIIFGDFVVVVDNGCIALVTVVFIVVESSCFVDDDFGFTVVVKVVEIVVCLLSSILTGSNGRLQ